MKIFDNLFQPFFSNGRFEENRKNQVFMATHFLDLYRRMQSESCGPRKVDFFFESSSREKAEHLASELSEMGYQVNDIYRGNGETYWITGTSLPILIEEEPFRKWIMQMNELGFLNDCIFDGWGMLGEIKA